MEFKIHFTAKGEEDSFVVEGDSIEEITSLAKKETNSRGLRYQKSIYANSRF